MINIHNIPSGCKAIHRNQNVSYELQKSSEEWLLDFYSEDKDLILYLHELSKEVNSYEWV